MSTVKLSAYLNRLSEGLKAYGDLPGLPSKSNKPLKSVFVAIVLLLCSATASFALDVTLRWDKVDQTSLAGYAVYYKTGNPGLPYNGTDADQGPSPIKVKLENLSDPENPEYTLTNLDAGCHSFVVTAYDSAQLESDFSNEASTCADADTTAPQFTSPLTVTDKTNTIATIQWETDEDSTSLVQYDTKSTSWGNYSNEKSNSALISNHTFVLTGLSANTTYYLRVGSVDSVGNGPTTSNEASFTTDSNPDQTAPTITAPPAVTTTSNSSATIEWKTDELSSSIVRYGTSSGSWGNYPSNKNSATMVSSHQVDLTGLKGNTNYYVRVGSTDSSGNGPTTSNEISFTTQPDPGFAFQGLPLSLNNSTPESADVVLALNQVPAGTTAIELVLTVDDADFSDEGRLFINGQGPIAMFGAQGVSSNDQTSVTLDPISTDGAWYQIGSNTLTFWHDSTQGYAIENISLNFTTPPQITESPEVTGKTNTTATIEWKTNEASNSSVQYGTGSSSWDNYPSTKNSSSQVTGHKVTLTGLQGSTTYYFRVASTDADGHGPTVSNEMSFSTDANPDTTAPYISDIQASTSDTSAVIQWTTDELSNSQVRFGTSSRAWDSYPTANRKNAPDMVKSHSVTITGLSPNTLYYFRVGSTDAVGNGPSPSAESSFTTEIVPDTTAPYISNIQASTTDTTNVIQWTTDEPSNSQVRYGTSSQAWNSYPTANRKNDPNMMKDHKVTITGLSPDTLYYFRVGSTDAAGNGPSTSAESNLTTEAPPDADPPSIVEFPTVDYATDTIDITFDESNMKHVTTESNYTFSPTLFFTTSANSGDIKEIDATTYRLAMTAIPNYTILTLTVKGITDETGNPLSPDSIRINDNDYDNMADDWEGANSLNPNDPNDVAGDSDNDGLTNLQEFNGGGSTSTDPNDPDTDNDGMDDGWELDSGTDPLVDDSEGDLDQDGFSNYQEYTSGTHPNDATSAPLAIKEVLPPPNSGIAADDERVSVDASVAIRIEADKGIDIKNPGNVVFYIEEEGVTSYSRKTGDASVRITKLSSDANAALGKLWVEYDRSSDPVFTTQYEFDTVVGVSVYVTDTASNSIASEVYRFRTETMAKHIEDQLNLPETETELLSPKQLKIKVKGKKPETMAIDGATIIFNADDGGVTPYFGPVEDVPAIDIPGVQGVGIPLSLKPSRTFPSGVTLFIPCPSGVDVETLCIYGYNESEWALVCDENGNVQPGGEGWLIPDWNDGTAREVLSDGDPSGVTIWVLHFSSISAGEPSLAAAGNGSFTGPVDDGGGACFISTLSSSSTQNTSQADSGLGNVKGLLALCLIPFVFFSLSESFAKREPDRANEEHPCSLLE